MSEQELLPCPFCGKEARNNRDCIQCKSCGAQGPYDDVSGWNKRLSSDAEEVYKIINRIFYNTSGSIDARDNTAKRLQAIAQYFSPLQSL